MIEAILKVGTQPSLATWVWGNKKIEDYTINETIRFQIHEPGRRPIPYQWESGVITGFCGPEAAIPMVELM